MTRSEQAKDAWVARRHRESKIDGLNALIKLATDHLDGRRIEKHAFAYYTPAKHTRHKDYRFRFCIGFTEGDYFRTLDELSARVHQFLSSLSD